MLRKYRLGFEIWGLVLFLAIMLPNLIWFAIPAPSDILRAQSVTPAADTVASVCQVLMAAALCLLKNRDGARRAAPLLIAAAVCCLLYYASWIAYYRGIVHAAVILGLTVLPCLAFFFFAMDRKNWIACIPISIFTICHLLHSVVNFLL